MSTTDEILAAFKALSPNEKWALLGSFWEVIPPEDWPLPSGAEVALLDARFAELDSGAVQSISREGAQKQLREQLSRYT